MITTRCKVVCNYIQPANNEKDGSAYLFFTPVTDGSEENKQFFKYTPGGQFQFYVINPEVVKNFEMGKEYYFDISPA